MTQLFDPTGLAGVTGGIAEFAPPGGVFGQGDIFRQALARQGLSPAARAASAAQFPLLSSSFLVQPERRFAAGGAPFTGADPFAQFLSAGAPSLQGAPLVSRIQALEEGLSQDVGQMTGPMAALQGRLQGIGGDAADALNLQREVASLPLMLSAAPGIRNALGAVIQRIMDTFLAATPEGNFLQFARNQPLFGLSGGGSTFGFSRG